ncbi:MAG TPA: endonuclease MutS2 [Pantanalinema sp.]
MDEKTLKMLEWPRVVELLCERATTESGKDRCRAIEIHTDLDAVSHALRLTTEARGLLIETQTFPMGGLQDLRGAIRRLDQGADLDGHELTAIAHTLVAARRLKSFLSDHDEEFPALAELGVPIVPLPKLTDEILRCFDPSGEVADHASPALGAIRRKLHETQGEIRTRLQRMLRSHANALQETIITMRGERFVLPVRSDAKGQVPGIVHDQSSTGMTLFIEPMAVVDLNNQVTKAHLDERDEIARILARLTQLVSANSEEIRWTMEAVAEIDFTYAKARLSMALDGHHPRLDREGATVVYGARHPLLVARGLSSETKGAKVVPIDVGVGDRHQVVVITGPNTGGKTVTLKTLGLVTLMTQAGLHPPVAPGSQVAVFRKVFADIGDEQSLQQNLSTFSGHMRNIIRITTYADHRTLVLLDELGAGTDPQEGAALARALIDVFIERGSRLVATTHYGELKLLAYEKSGIINASVEFDVKSLSPTYRLLMGVPGQSNAITIASALGLPPVVAASAKEYLSRGKDDAAEVISRLEAEQHAAAVARADADRKLAEAERMRAEYEAKLANWSQERKDLREKARDALDQELESARAEIASVTRELQGARTAQTAQKAHDRISKLKHRMQKTERPANTVNARTLLVGDRVFLPRLNQTGIVQSLPDASGEVVLQIGIMKVTARLAELQIEPKGGDKGAKAASKASAPEPQAFKPSRKAGRSGAEEPGRQAGMEIDLRGMMVHEAITELENFLDTAMEADLKSVWIIHGAGTGALRKGIRDHLRTSPYAASFRPGGHGEGGDGVTVVQLS